MRAEIGIVGGSGLYDAREISGLEEVSLSTPFGEPSGPYAVGEMEGRKVAFLARHGRGHRLAPGEINFRANIYGFKLLGVERILSAGAVGSMKESIHPTHLVFPDQFVDLTKGRPSSFFGQGLVAHVAFADPVCPVLRAHAAASARAAGATVHDGGAYVCIEGPQFSTRAESNIYRSWGVSVIGMTNVQEAKLAREAEICYATMALVTDFDCWHVSEQPVTVEALLDSLRANAATARRVIARAVASLPARSCGCGTALRDALITDPGVVPAPVRERLAPIVGKYLA
ncbi:MAG TPA: S-methyl-5'-thioadenosine phosphorylase [Candidatus Polarisedimenticolia bacterium]|nr:S-methyl-5'-thioadenosine phosphorylase [Candidatus Polarisedimenticolia bacterium]